MNNRYNFVFPVATLTGSDFTLEPWDSSKHATAFYKATGPAPDLYRHMSIGPFPTEESLTEGFITARIMNPANQLYAIMTTRRTKAQSSAPEIPSLAGMVGFCSTSVEHCETEIGPIILTPEYQGVGLAASVVEVMTAHALRPEAEGGWGLWRVQWLSDTANASSIRLAEKSGFRREGIIRGHMVYRDGVRREKIGNGRGVPPWTNEGDLGRDSVMLARCWDD